MLTLSENWYKLHELVSIGRDRSAKLIRNEHFQLVHVRRQEGKVQMSLISPCNLDKDYQNDILAKGYNCISHIWGDPTQWVTWTDHGVVDSNGNPIPVAMRPEKYETLMELMFTRGTYWWIDVFCSVKNDNQFIIMADVFRNCKECYAMTDCDHPSLRNFDRVQQIYQTYCSAFLIAEQRDLSLDDYTLNVCERLGGLPISSETIPWTSIFEVFWVGSEAPESRALIEDEIEALSSLLSKYWWERVWTLQEVFLPRQTYLLAECGQCKALVELKAITSILNDIMFILQNVNKIHKLDTDPLYDRQYNAILAKLEGMTSHKLIKYNPKLTGVPHGIRDKIKPLLLSSFSSSTRRAFTPSDYVYAVLGLLDIKIPRFEDPNDTWHAFRKELHKYCICADEDFNLNRAKCMGDVFQQFRSE